MNILGISTIYIGIPMGNTTGFKKKKDYTSILELDIIIIKNIKERGDNNPNNSNNNKNNKKIKISKSNKYYGEWEKFKP